MLPNLRKDEHLYPVPKFDLKKSDFKDLMNKVKHIVNQMDQCVYVFLMLGYGAPNRR